MDKALFSSASTEYETPWELFNPLNDIYHFTVDVCATAKNTKCKIFYSKTENGLAQKWSGTCWMNPPYGRNVEPWIKKAYESAITGDAVVVALLPSRTDTKWFHRYINGKAEIRFLEGRVSFIKNGKSGPATFPSMIVIWNKRVRR
ncbi:MAG: phage N-6-adenine-methyltransferase [Treponema sp.]|jgi:phage N-6-adenine-methyltransferase|nr:phage N-6-adenine-methyltransferase [Treponema sp.]